MVGLVVGIVYFWGNGVSWPQLALMTVMYIATGMGITVGYHRLFTHKSFSAGPVVTSAIGILGSMAAEGSLLRWCAAHRRHHQFSDHDGDPHSPHLHDHGHGLRGIISGFYHAHMGWIFDPPGESLDRYVPDLIRDRRIRRISELFPLWVALGFVIPALLGGLLNLAIGAPFWTGVFLGFIWGGLVRVMVVHHITWSVNSVCHIWGSQPYRSGDESRNNVVVGVLALGEGWHNNHHAFPTSARHGLEWWQFDSSWMVIRGLQALGLVRNVRVPTAERKAAKLRNAPPAAPKIRDAA
ncbi:MAG: acyl-CoA desaturase [Phycisphaerae bacterium]|nr:acyl-CoA desaturase [Phycisphaerae bacterium]OUX01552.1 MAG: acyl-CoA desaturase [Phycisphaeraceae bacterium TMED231]